MTEGHSENKAICPCEGTGYCDCEDVAELRAEVDRLRLAMLGRGIAMTVLAGWLESAEQDVCDAEASAEASEADLAAMTERAERAEAELADGAMRRAFDKIADYVCPGWEYPGQVVRAVIEEDEQ